MNDSSQAAIVSGGPSHDRAAGRAAAGAQVHDPVAEPDDVEVVLHEHDRVAALDEVVEHAEQALDVGPVQADRGLVEQVERRAGAALGEFARDLQALGLAARQLVRGWPSRR